MCDEMMAGHPELWITSVPRNRGADGNVELWQGAESELDRLCREAEKAGVEYNEGALCALTDAYNRCIEERRRAEDLRKLRDRWSTRRIGGVVEPR